MYKSSTYRNIHKHVKRHVHKHAGRHVFKHAHKATHHAHHTHHAMLHIGELILVGAIGFMSLIFAGSVNLPNNTSFSYPLQKVSTVECRTLYRNDMPNSCKINLPIIHGANYKAYENDSVYRSIYTALRASPYSDSWNQKLGAHAGLDVATARGTPLYSIGDGEVYSAGRNSAYGNVIKIKYIYNGEIVYAVYAHMDTMDVKKGDKVSKGQRVGAVGNSGNTFGALGGYHVHFEIDKDNYGRPAYSYTNCPDLSKGHYKIIQNGLCRTELFTYQYDPIKLFEANYTYVPDEELGDEDIIDNEKEIASVGSGSNLDADTGELEEKSEDEEVEEDLSANDNSSTDKDIDKWKEVIKDNENKDDTDDIENNETTNIDKDINKGSNQDNQEEDVHNATNENILDDSETSNNTVDSDKEDANNLDEEDPTLLELNFEGVSLLATHFLNLWDIEMHSDLMEKDLLVGESIALEVDIFKKSEDEETKEKNKKYNGFKGILQLPFLFIAANDSIDIDVNYLQLITKGKAEVIVTGKKVGSSSLVIEFGEKKIGVLEINIK